MTTPVAFKGPAFLKTHILFLLDLLSLPPALLDVRGSEAATVIHILRACLNLVVVETRKARRKTTFLLFVVWAILHRFHLLALADQLVLPILHQGRPQGISPA